MLLFLLFLTFFPFFIAILTSLKSFQQLLVNFWLPAFPLQLQNYVMAWNEIYRSIINSSLVSIGAVTGVLLCASLAAYAFARIDFAWRDGAYYLVLSLLMIPSVLTLIGRYLPDRRVRADEFAVGVDPALYRRRDCLCRLSADRFLLRSAGGAVRGGQDGRRHRVADVPPDRAAAVATDHGDRRPAHFSVVVGDYVWPLLVLRSKEKFTLMLGLATFTGNTQVMFGPLMAGYVIASIPTAIIIILMMRTFAGAALVGAFK